MMQQIRQMDELKSEVTQMGSSSQSMLRNIGDTVNYLNSLEEEFKKLRHDCSNLGKMNHEMNGSLANIENTYIKRTSI
jgi:septal ring factor EnvC (AmiA/AmiB activator)